MYFGEDSGGAGGGGGGGGGGHGGSGDDSGYVTSRFAGATSISSSDVFGGGSPGHNTNGEFENIKRLGQDALRKAANFFDQIR